MLIICCMNYYKVVADNTFMDYQEALKSKIFGLMEIRDKVNELHQYSIPGQLTKLDYEAIMADFKLSLKIIALLDHYRESFPEDPHYDIIVKSLQDLEEVIESTAHSLVDNLGLLNTYLK